MARVEEKALFHPISWFGIGSNTPCVVLDTSSRVWVRFVLLLKFLTSTVSDLDNLAWSFLPNTEVLWFYSFFWVYSLLEAFHIKQLLEQQIPSANLWLPGCGEQFLHTKSSYAFILPPASRNSFLLPTLPFISCFCIFLHLGWLLLLYSSLICESRRPTNQLFLQAHLNTCYFFHPRKARQWLLIGSISLWNGFEKQEKRFSKYFPLESAMRTEISVLGFLVPEKGNEVLVGSF